MRMRRFASLALAFVILPAAALTPMPIVGPTWAWFPAVGDGATPGFVPERHTIEFRPDGSLVVQADCNRGKGNYRHDADQLSIGPLAVTKKACPPPSRGDEFARRLSAVDGYRYEGIELLLTSSTGLRELRLRPLSR
jgi:heat shock protein HslJ